VTERKHPIKEGCATLEMHSEKIEKEKKVKILSRKTEKLNKKLKGYILHTTYVRESLKPLNRSRDEGNS
jgi:hypothetical protein